MNIPAPIHIMTASLSPGDAIGNYILTLKGLLEALGIEVRLYADHVAPVYRGVANFSSDYQPGRGLLWYHYSIYAENLALISQPIEYRIMDYHGVSPPRLFSEHNAYLADLCQRGIAKLPEYRGIFNLSIAHSDYTCQELLDIGFKWVEKLPLIVDMNRFSQEDATLAHWLAQLPYLLFVGRIVPQKDILAMLKIFAHFSRLQPDAVLVLVGGRDLVPGYQHQIDRLMQRLKLSQRVLFTGQINDAKMLASFYRYARFTLITSEWESFCVPLVESMAFDTPVIAHQIPPLPEVLGEAGILIDKHAPEAAAALIKGAWDDPAQYRQLVQHCRQRADAFSIAQLRQDLLALLKRISDHG